jgi:hypothetical protein
MILSTERYILNASTIEWNVKHEEIKIML